MNAALDWTFAAMAAPFVAAALAPLLHKVMEAWAGWALALVPAAMFFHFTGLVPAVSNGIVVLGGVPWAPQLNVHLSYFVDGLSLTFALLITGIGTFIILYSGGYLKGHRHQGRFFSFMFLFMGAMLGLVLADDFLTLFVFWELTSITSFLLIGFDHTRMAARRAALQALIITGGGGLALLAGLLLMIPVTGIQSMSDALALGDAVKEHPFYVPILILVLGGAFTKSAQFPLHVWLPNAMEAPTPVSAYLHSATMVKAGVYLLMRVHPFLGDTLLWTTILPVFGAATLLAGTFLAIRQTDLKLVLAYTTVASLGLLVLLVGTSLEEAIAGAVIYLVAHSLFKGGLFMVAGAIDHGTGTRDVRDLSGLVGAMPITFAAAFVAAWSMGGLPLSMGFLGKETMYEGLWHAAFPETLGEPSGVAGLVLLLALALLVAVVLGNALMFAAGFAVATLPFFGPRRETPHHPHEAPPSMLAGPLTLALCGILGLVFAKFTKTVVLDPMTGAILGPGVEVDVYASPAIHLNVALALSAVTVALGLLALWRIAALRGLFARTLAAIGWGPDRGFDQFVSGLTRGAAGVTRVVQTGRMELYLGLTFVVVAIALLGGLTVFDEWPRRLEQPTLTFYEWAIVGLAALGLVAVLVAENRLVAIVSLGIQGFAVALLFMLFGAPDLSFTQFMVETLSVIILTLVMTRLALHPADHRPFLDKARDGITALACGVGFAALLMAVTAAPFDSRLSDFFEANSRTIAHGRNIVNVIIVDFRGLDTLGEIAVVMIAGLAILALLRVRTRRADEEVET